MHAIFGLIENEHPQTVALILSTQKDEHTSRILAELPDDTRGEVMYRIAKIDNVSPEVISQIEEALQREVGVVVGKDRKQVGGVEKVVEILGKMDKGQDQVILTSIEATDPDDDALTYAWYIDGTREGPSAPSVTWAEPMSEAARLSRVRRLLTT